METQSYQIRSLLDKAQAYLDFMQQTGESFIPKSADRAAESVSQSGRDPILHLREEVLTCIKCDQLVQTRKTVVFGAGQAHARLMFVGEAPGFEEDVQGLPFVGKAGQLLTKIIEAMGLTRKEVFICNVLKCRPPGNRNPLPEEVMNCKPYLMKQIDFVGPQLICALGNFAAQVLLQTDRSISELRGRFYDLNGIKVLPTYHPAYLLRNPSEKKKVWQDMQLIMAELGLENSLKSR